MIHPKHIASICCLIFTACGDLTPTELGAAAIDIEQETHPVQEASLQTSIALVALPTLNPTAPQRYEHPIWLEALPALLDNPIDGGPDDGQVPAPPAQATPGDDEFSGTDGDDVLNGLQGDDRISGGAGSDRINGNEGDDFINGNTGDDVVRGGKGDDTVRGGQGNDTLYGDLGDDHLYGDRGDDTYIFRPHTQNMFIHPEGGGFDTLICDGPDTLFETYSGDDLMLWMSNGGTIRIIGLLVRDTVQTIEGCGQDFGPTPPREEITGSDDGDVITADGGSFRISGMGGSDDISGLSGNDIINGNTGDDRINGNTGDDFVRGGQGNDFVRGGQGNDVVLGDRGDDDLYGDRGDDTYVYQEQSENITIYPHPTDGGFDRLVCFGARQLLFHREGSDLVMEMDTGGTIRIIDQYITSTVDEFAGCTD